MVRFMLHDASFEAFQLPLLGFPVDIGIRERDVRMARHGNVDTRQTQAAFLICVRFFAARRDLRVDEGAHLAIDGRQAHAHVAVHLRCCESYAVGFDHGLGHALGELFDFLRDLRDLHGLLAKHGVILADHNGQNCYRSILTDNGKRTTGNRVVLVHERTLNLASGT